MANPSSSQASRSGSSSADPQAGQNVLRVVVGRPTGLTLGNAAEAASVDPEESISVLQPGVLDKLAEPGRRNAREDDFASLGAASAEEHPTVSRPAPNFTPMGGAGPALVTIETTADRFEMQGVVAMGGCGEIRAAVQRSLGRTVAVKVIRPDLLPSQDLDPRAAAWAKEMFRAEAVTTAMLEHPSIVPVYDYGTDAEGNPLIAMQLVKGEPWNKVLSRDFETLSVDDHLAKHLPIFVSTMQAVAFAHSRNIVHRDLKPTQVMIGEFGEVLLMDWGMAMSLVPSEASRAAPRDFLAELGVATPQTATSPSGTPAYMAPEQTLTHATQVTTATDVYLLGGTLYYILTNCPPRRGANAADTINLAAQGYVVPARQAAPNRTIPAELERLVERCLLPHIEQRPQRVAEVIDAVTAYLTGASSRAAAEVLVQEAKLGVAALQGEFGAGDERASELYTAASELLSKLDQIATLWPRNTELPGLRTQVLLRYAETAIANNDLMLARGLVGLLDAPERREELLRKIEASHQRIQAERRQRRILYYSLFILITFFAILSYAFMRNEQRSAVRIAKERDAADRARHVAEEARTLATSLQKHAEAEQYFASIAAADGATNAYSREKAAKLLLEGTPPNRRNLEWGLLADRVFDDYFTMAPLQFLPSASVSLDGKRFLSGSRDGSVHEWDTATGRYTNITPWFSSRLYEVDVSPDGTRLLLPTYGKLAAIADAATGKQLHRISTTGYIRGCAWSPDGARIALTNLDRFVEVYDARTAALLITFRDFARAPRVCAFGGDSRTLVVGSDGGTCQAFDVVGGRVLGEARGHGNTISDLKFSPDHRQFATACYDGLVRVFDAQTLQAISVTPMPTRSASCLAFIPNSPYLAAATEEGQLCVLEANTGTSVTTRLGVQAAYQCTPSPDGKWLYVAGRFKVHAYNVERLLERPTVLPARADGSQITSVMKIFGLTAGREPSWLERERNWNTPLGRTLVRVAPDEVVSVESRYAAFSGDGKWKFEMDKNSNSLQGLVKDRRTGQVVFQAGKARLLTGLFSPDSKRLALVDPLNSIRLVSTTNWNTVGTLQAAATTSESSGLNAYIVGAAGFSPDSTALAAGYLNGRIIMWDVVSGEPRWKSEKTIGVGAALTFNVSGSQLLVCGNDDRITLWDTQSGKRLNSLVGHDRAVIGAVFNPKGDRILSIARDDTARLWDVQSGREIMTVFTGSSENTLLGVAMTSDGRSAVLAQRDGTVAALHSLPFDAASLREPATSGSLTQEQSMELFMRRRLLGPSITAADVTEVPPGAK